MNKLPFVSQSSQMRVIDHLCRCGNKWSEHVHDDETGDRHGGGHSCGCPKFRFVGYMYEQAKIEHESLESKPIVEKADSVIM